MTTPENLEFDQTDPAEVQTDGSPWSELPSPALEKVYSFLNRSDQINMSLVCRSWHNEYSSPSLWRKMTFRLPVGEKTTRICPEIIFARRFGSWFHHVKIVLPYQPFADYLGDPVTAVMWKLKLLALFLDVLVLKSQLLSISFENLGPYLQFKDKFHSVVHQMIFCFIKSQRKLRSVKVGDPFESAGEVMKVLFAKNSNTLRHLYIPPFVLKKYDGISSDIAVDDELVFFAFMNLEKLEVEYSAEFEKMMWSFYEYRSRVDMRKRTGRLKEMRLIRGGYGRVNRINILVWKYFRKIFPGLRIDLQIGCDSLKSTFIVPEMPLRRLDFFHPVSPGHYEDIGTLLRHITACDLNKSLEVLKITWYDSALNLAPDLISFTNACSELKTLELLLEHPVVGLDSVFSSWMKNRPVSLQTVKIIIFTGTRKEDMIYTNLYDFYAPLLRPLKLIIV